MSEKTPDKPASILADFRTVAEGSNGMFPISTSCAKLDGCVVVAYRGNDLFHSDRIFHNEQLAEAETRRQRVLFDIAVVDGLSLYARCNGGEVEFYGTILATDEEIIDYCEVRPIERSGQGRSTVIDRMQNLVDGSGVVSGWVLLAWRYDGVHIYQSVFSCKELAEREAIRQRPFFDRFSIERITIEAELGDDENGFAVNFFEQPLRLRRIMSEIR